MRLALAPRQRDRVARVYVTVTTEVCASSLYYFGALPAPALRLRLRLRVRVCAELEEIDIPGSRLGRPPLRFAATETDI